MNLKEIMLANGIDNAVIDKIASEMKANKISELIKAYRKKEVNNINKGKLGIQTKLKMNEDEMKSKKIYNNLLHLLRQK